MYVSAWLYCPSNKTSQLVLVLQQNGLTCSVCLDKTLQLQLAISCTHIRHPQSTKGNSLPLEGNHTLSKVIPFDRFTVSYLWNNILKSLWEIKKKTTLFMQSMCGDYSGCLSTSMITQHRVKVSLFSYSLQISTSTDFADKLVSLLLKVIWDPQFQSSTAIGWRRAIN